MRKPGIVLLSASLLAGVCLAIGCGGGEKAKQSELNQLRQKIRDTKKDEDRLIKMKGEAVAIRTRLQILANDDLRRDPTTLEERLQDTGTRIGLNKVRRLVEEGEDGVEGPVRWRRYRIKVRGNNDSLRRWIQDMVTWPVVIRPYRLVSQKDAIGNFEHEFFFALPSGWTLPPESPDPSDPPDPGPLPEGEVAYQIWLMQQNVARIQEAQKVLPATERELEALEKLEADIQTHAEEGRLFAAALGDILESSRRAGSLQGFVLEPARAEVTAVVLNQNTLASFLGYLDGAPTLRDAATESTESTRVGLRAVVSMVVAPE